MIKLYIKEWCQRQTPKRTARQLAADCDIPEVSLYRIMSGNSWVERERLEKIAEVLGIPANDLFVDPATKDGRQTDGITCPKCGYHMHIKAE